jgi:hypothetical protein
VGGDLARNTDEYPQLSRAEPAFIEDAGMDSSQIESKNDVGIFAEFNNFP